jgi:hypothetical protein
LKSTTPLEAPFPRFSSPRTSAPAHRLRDRQFPWFTNIYSVPEHNKPATIPASAFHPPPRHLRAKPFFDTWEPNFPLLMFAIQKAKKHMIIYPEKENEGIGDNGGNGESAIYERFDYHPQGAA